MFNTSFLFYLQRERDSDPFKRAAGGPTAPPARPLSVPLPPGGGGGGAAAAAARQADPLRTACRGDAVAVPPLTAILSSASLLRRPPPPPPSSAPLLRLPVQTDVSL